MARSILKLLLLVALSAQGQQTLTNVFTGSFPNSHDGDPANIAFQKLNTNDVFLQAQVAQRVATNGGTLFNPTVVGTMTAATVAGVFFGNGAGISNVIATVPNAILSNTGRGTNTTINTLAIQGTTFGQADQTLHFGSGGPNNPGDYLPYYGWRIQQGGPNGWQLEGPDRDPIMYIYDLDIHNRIPQGSWHREPAGNFIPQGATVSGGGLYRNAGAAADFYMNSYSGSGSGLADLTARTSDMHLNQTKPFFIFSTRLNDNSLADNYTACNYTTVTNALNAFNTNGCLATWTNLGLGIAMELDSGGWLTNHRDSATGLLRINTNNFYNETGHDTALTNTANFISSYGVEPWLMCYIAARVPSIQNWPNSAFSELDVDQTGNGVWEYPGGNNGTSGVHLQPAITTDSAHKDISTFYAWGFKGFIGQDTLDGSGNGAGAFDQTFRTVSCTSVNPYFNPGQSSQIGLDAPWSRWYSGNHGLIVGYLVGAGGNIWVPKIQADMNQVWVESNEATQTSGSGALSWIMGQIRFNALFLTNLTLNCFPTLAGDGQGAPGWNYQNWYDYAAAHAMFNFNPFLGRSYDYTTNAYWGGIFTNRFWIPAWQDVLRPVNCITLNNSNSVWSVSKHNGDKLVWFVNEANTSTNLTATWGNLGIITNTPCTISDLITNMGLATASSSYTWNTPAHSTMLIRVTPPTAVPVLAGSFLSGGTNSMTTWPTAAQTPGGWAIVTSNATVYMLASTPGGTAWASTNLLAKGQ